MHAEDGGQVFRHVVRIEFQFGANAINGGVLPGVPNRREAPAPGYDPRDDDDAPDERAYVDENGRRLDPQPVHDDGQVNIRAVWLAYYDGERVAYRTMVYGRWTPWRAPLADDDYYEQIYNHIDELEPAPVLEIPVDGDGGNVYPFVSGVPIAFLKSTKYPDPNVGLLKDSEFTTETYMRIDESNTILSHRPDPLILGYRKDDIAMYVLAWKGLGDKKSDTQFGGPNRVRLDMSNFCAKLGLIMTWWSYSMVDSVKGVSLLGQPQVLTPLDSDFSRRGLYPGHKSVSH